MQAIKWSGKPNHEQQIQLTAEKRAYQIYNATVEL